MVTLVYSQKGPPSWLADAQLIDEVHHLTGIAVKNRFVYITPTAVQRHDGYECYSSRLMRYDLITMKQRVPCSGECHCTVKATAPSIDSDGNQLLS